MVSNSSGALPRIPGLAPALGVLGALVAGFLVLAAGLLAAGYDVGLALAALWRGAFGSWDALLSATLVRAVPLIVLGTGIAIAFRAGALNIGGEGQFYAGAIAATWVGLQVTQWPAVAAVPAVWVAAALGGVAWIAIPVLLRVRFGVLEVISTLLLNFIAEAMVSFAVTGPLQEARRVYPQSDPIGEAARLPLVPGSRLHLGLLLALLLAVAAWFLFTKTVWGFRLKAVGEAPLAAAISGRIPTKRVLGFALLWSGGFAGLAGGVELSGVTYSLYQNLSPGYGYTAIAVALLARLHPLGVVLTGILFGALEAGAQGMQREAGVPAVAVAVAEAVIILAVLLAEVRSRQSGELAEAAPRARRFFPGWGSRRP